MNAIVNFNSQTMGTREISSLTGKEHRHVKRDCETMFIELELDPQGYVQNWTHPQNGQTYTEYALTKDLVETLVTGYSIKLRHAVLNRLRELEKQVQQNLITMPNFTDPAEAAMAWATQYKANQVAEKKIALLEPKAQALDTIANTTNIYTIRDCAKTIGIGERKLIQLLIDKKWIYREEHGRLQPYADKVASGVFVNKASPVVTNRYTGEEKVHLHMRVTAFGLTRITGLIKKLEMAA